MSGDEQAASAVSRIFGEKPPVLCREALRALLHGFSAEVVGKDRKSIEAATAMPAGAEVFVANLPTDTANDVVRACERIRALGRTPVPHVVARNIRDRASLDQMLGHLAGRAGVDTALVLAGDRDEAAGEFTASLDLLQTGLFQVHGFRRIAFGCHPEGHPKVPNPVLSRALGSKLRWARDEGIDAYLISQFAFEADPIVGFARTLRTAGFHEPLRVGVAGPAKRTTLIKYAMLCGVGPSLRALRERQALTRSLLAGETPEALLTELARAQENEPGLGLAGIHFFTFGSLAASVELGLSLLIQGRM